MKKNTLTSIVVPVKNRAALLQELIESVLAQDIASWELIIVDDGSDDETIDIGMRYQRQDPRIRFATRSSPNPGASVCRNEGLKMAGGDFVVFIDSDDLIEPDCINGRVSAMLSDPSLDFVVFQGGLFVNEFGDYEEGVSVFGDNADHIDRFLELDFVWHTNAPMWRKTSIERIGGWKESLPNRQDWELWIRALSHGLRYETFDQPDFWARLSGGTREAMGMYQKTFRYAEGILMASLACSESLKTSGLLNKRRQRAIGGNYLLAVYTMQDAMHRRDALQTWLMLYRTG
ncbi:MAG: glycosyltransferase family 2 protein, partial [Pseudomonadota bacterium]